MKSLLTEWLKDAPEILTRELSGKVDLRASDRLPKPDAALTVAVLLGSAWNGRFLITVDRDALRAMLVAARLLAADGEQAAQDRELWGGILEQIAVAAARSLDPACAIDVSIEDALWTLGQPSAAYEVHFSEQVMLVAFTDQIEIPQAATRPTVATSSTPSTSARAAPGGIDLLLDVELETSLRFGSREMPLSELLDLGAGDVVELDRHVSDAVDLLVGDKIVARGEVVLVNGSFGLRVIEVAEPKKCLESIRCLF